MRSSFQGGNPTKSALMSDLFGPALKFDEQNVPFYFQCYPAGHCSMLEHRNTFGYVIELALEA